MSGHAGISVPWEDARLVEVVATTPHGVALHPWWPLPLDGLLASAARRRRHDVSQGTVVDHHVEPLPLSILRPVNVGDRGNRISHRWSWAATCATFDAPAGEEIRWRHHRTDWADAIDRGISVPPVIREVGRYRTWRLPSHITLAGELRWRACGDPARISDLLADIRSVGRHRARGEGLVVRWEVHDLGRAVDNPWRVVWHDTGRIARPLSARWAATLAVGAPETVDGCYRPPYWRAPQHQSGSALTRTWRPVLAPWTVRDRQMR